MLKRVALFLVAAVMLFGAMPAFAATSITVWHSYRGKEKEALEQVTKTFNDKNKEIQIVLVNIPYDAFADKITASIPRGRGPDLFIFAQDRIGDWAAAGLIEAVDFWLTDELRGAFLPPTMEALTYDDAVYGLPMAYKMVALFYNTKLVDKAPATTGEMLAAAKKATNKSKGTFGLVYENANFYHHAVWMQAFGGRVFDKKGQPTLDSPGVIDSLKFAQDLAKKEEIMPQEASSTLVSTLFNTGKAAFVINGPWFLGEIDKNVSFAVATVPVVDATKKPGAPFLTAEGVIMSAKTVDKKAAFEVMTYLTSLETGKVMAKVGRQPVANKKVYDDAEVAKDPLLSVFKKQLESSLPMPNTPAMRMVWSPATTMMNKVINGGADPATAAKECQAEVAKLVKGARR
jgi:arabinogalactan oligomer/maltooligosaccharide transport system substrate-binding protein